MEGDNFNLFESLVNLENLHMNDNFLVYDEGLPSQFGKMTNLKSIKLSYNILGGQLEGTYPILPGLNQLTHLELESNFFNGTFPEAIGLLTNLASLSLSDSSLSGTIRNELGNLSGLRRLWLYGNKLEGTIPKTLENLSLLEVAEFHNNSLSGPMPFGVCDMVQSNDYKVKSLTSDCLQSQVECDSTFCCTGCF
ncbi:MAG: Leucine-rich repeat (LRR) protein [Bacillariaceae sp.]|jgi:Leucine-rich repeat (LRR) protein